MKRLLAMILCVCCIFALVSCELPIREYKGTPICNLTYESIDYNGGYTNTYVIDFENNLVKHRGYLPYGDEEAEFEIIAVFSDEEEKELINKLYSYGLFCIQDNYPSAPGIIDGGGWNLAIEYSDGTTKKSSGSNNSPSLVFSNCAKAFYDICRDGIVGYVPTEYYTPPHLSYTLRNNNSFYDYISSYGKRLNYEWNGFESKGNGIYEANLDTDYPYEFYEGEKYSLVLYTANYSTSNYYERFKKIFVKSYDNNENLTNEAVVHSGGWFDKIEFDLELNKIYLVRLEFSSGDFVEYTFNTNTTSI